MPVQNLWIESGDFWQNQWNKIRYICGNDSYVIEAYGTFVVTMLVYWIAGGIYTLVDMTGKPTFLLRYKIQDNAPYPVSRSQVLNTLKQVIINQTLIAIPFGLLVYLAREWRGCSSRIQLPTFQRGLVELFLCVLVEETCFYYSHRLLHNPHIYKYVHKQHHEWTSPIAITAIYCHPIEHISSNLLPAMLGPLLLGSHTAITWLWYAIALLSTLNAHSGYHFPFFPSPEAHDYHHLKFTENYGMLGVLDTIHGTNKTFLQSRIYKRHKTYLHLDSIKQRYPDESKQKK